MEYTNYVFCHKDFEWSFGNYVNSQYTALTTHDVKTNLNLVKFNTDLPDEIYGEIPYMLWIKDNCKTDWFSTNHYRRQFQPVYGVPCYTEMRFGCSLADQFAYYHSSKLLNQFINYLLKTDKPLADAFVVSLKSNVFCPYNIMSGPIEMAKDWVNVVAAPVIGFIRERTWYKNH